MKFSEKLVWKAVYEFVPAYKVARENKVPVNLPMSIKDAALIAFIECGLAGLSSLGQDRSYAAYILQATLKEINTVGFMTFGNQEQYWA